MNRSLLLLPLLLSACAIAMGPPATAADGLPVALYDVGGARIGTAVLTADETGLTIMVDVAGLPPGVHAVHIHEHGLCERPEKFTTLPVDQAAVERHILSLSRAAREGAAA